MRSTTTSRGGAVSGHTWGTHRPLTQWLRSIVQALRDAREAEWMYRDLSRLCDRALQQRGIGREHVLSRVFDRLTGSGRD